MSLILFYVSSVFSLFKNKAQFQELSSKIKCQKCKFFQVIHPMITKLPLLFNADEFIYDHLKLQKEKKKYETFQKYLTLNCRNKAGTYLQPHCGNGVFGNVYLSAGQH